MLLGVFWLAELEFELISYVKIYDFITLSSNTLFRRNQYGNKIEMINKVLGR